jgi:DNA-directed RNA polymerase subunit RPC12/RpoP
MVRFACEHCGRPIRVEAKHASRKGKCPKCGKIVMVPEGTTLITFRCDQCGRKISVPAVHAGKKGRCPACKNAVVVPRREDRPGEGGQAIGVTCPLCGQAITLAPGSAEAFVECPGCGAAVEIRPDGVLPGPEAPLPLGEEEDSAEESPGRDDRSSGPGRRPIVLALAAAAVVVVAAVVLVLVLRSSGSRLPAGSSDPRETAATDLRPQAAVPPTSPAAPIAQDLVRKETASVESAPAAAPAHLQFRPAPGTRRTVQLVTQTTMSMEQGGRQSDTTTTESMDFDLEVAESAGDGTIAVNTRLVTLRQKMAVQGQTVGEYDSSKPQGTGDTVAGIYAPFLDNRFTVKVSPRGEIVDPGLEELFRTAAERRVQEEDEMMREQAQERADLAIRRTDERFGSREGRVLAMKKQLEEFPVFGRKRMAGLLASLCAVLPDRPVRAGDAWEDTFNVDADARIQMAATYSVTTVGPDICTIEAVARRSPDEEPVVYDMGPVRVSNRLGGSSQATLEIECGTGWLFRSEYKTTLQGQSKTTTSGPQAQEFSGHVSLETTSTLTTVK